MSVIRQFPRVKPPRFIRFELFLNSQTESQIKTLAKEIEDAIQEIDTHFSQV
jgi:hypothetical protein